MTKLMLFIFSFFRVAISKGMQYCGCIMFFVNFTGIFLVSNHISLTLGWVNCNLKGRVSIIYPILQLMIAYNPNQCEYHVIRKDLMLNKAS